ncbi:MAG: dinitrogenase iron-molybdenum cofactor biosynthesis protein [Myxococcales bacterium]|nr:MAG: dinitrogenase iron-molybdenum cofactor biosynthesis protein [Myxococcales bacterium]
MKIAITTTGPGWDASVDERFGRAKGFALVEVGGKEPSISFIENSQNLQAVQGAGIQAAESVSRNGAKALLTGHVGPKAFRVLSAAGVEIYLGVKGTVRQAFEAYAKGELRRAESADAEGHW